MSMKKGDPAEKDRQIWIVDIGSLVPNNHLVRKLDAVIDWAFIYPLVEDLYSDIGRESIDPVILFKMVFINYIFGLNSMRKTCDEIQVNMAYRWFLGISMYDTVPNYSTFSQNYIRRYKKSGVFEKIFKHILEEAASHRLIDMSETFADATHIKANANKNKYRNKEVEIKAKAYQESLDKEIAEERENTGKKELKKKDETEYKNIKASKTDPESGYFHKGEKERVFAYTASTICDSKGFVLGTTISPGNVHDSTAFFELYTNVILKNRECINYLSLDAGYKIPAICKVLYDSDITPVMPYKRPMTKKGYFKKYEYIYDLEKNQYMCPNNKVLKYSTVDRNGYKMYKSNPSDCVNCPYIEKCTASKNHQKIVTRHIWEEYKEAAEKLRKTKEHKEIYPKRKQTIERVFADGKEKYCLRYTRFRGKERVKDSVLLIFAGMNLKKMANWIIKDTVAA